LTEEPQINSDPSKTPHIETRASEEDLHRSKSLAVGSQTKKPQLAKSTFNLKEKQQQQQQPLPQKINYSGYGLNPNR
jgi:hypothetical protein